LRSERFYGKMQRQLQLPHDIDEARAAAEYKDGILVLTLPKRAPDIQKKLTIK
jgi:HSP20 family protein